ncbi:MAG: AMP-binding protein [Cellvibrionaceae bacterium]
MPTSLGVVETNSIDYIRILFDALKSGTVVAPLRSIDDEERKQLAQVDKVVAPVAECGWFRDELHLSNTDDIAHISFTSGTEGLPKGVFLARSSLIDVVDRVQVLMEMTSEAKEYIGVPVYHSFGYGRCRHVASVGGAFYIPKSGFDPREVSNMLASGDINALSLVPSLLRVFIHNPGILGEERHNLRWLEIGSQAMSPDEKDAIRSLFPSARIVQHYGLTEASRTTLLQIDGCDERFLGSVGQAYGSCEIKINEGGRICIKGPHVAISLVKDSLLIAATDEQGWFETSDIGSIKDGYLYFEGRADNLVNCGGQKISTEKVELAMLAKLAEMENVSGAIAVSRIPHKVYGEGFLISFTSEYDAKTVKSIASESLGTMGIKAKNAMTMNPVVLIPKTHTGKVQHRILVADFEKNNTDTTKSKQAKSSNSIEALFVDVLGLSPNDFVSSDSVSSIGIDSIQSVQFSLRLESVLGFLPNEWRQLSIKDLSSLPVRKISAAPAKQFSGNGKARPIWDGSSNMNPSGISFWALLKEDFVTHEKDFMSQGFFALFVNRFGNWRMGIKNKFLRAPLSLLYLLFIKIAQVFCGIKLDYTVHVGRRVKLEHFGGMILGARSIGDDTIIRQNTTFGIRDMTDLASKPTIEQGVNIGAGVVIVGDITVGRHSVIGPNCVITEDLPPFSVVSVTPCTVTNVADLSKKS